MDTNSTNSYFPSHYVRNQYSNAPRSIRAEHVVQHQPNLYHQQTNIDQRFRLPSNNVLPPQRFESPANATTYLTQIPQPVYSTNAFKNMNQLANSYQDTVVLESEGLPPNTVNPIGNVMTTPYKAEPESTEAPKNLVTKPESSKTTVKAEPKEESDTVGQTEGVKKTKEAEKTEETTKAKVEKEVEEDDTDKELYEKNAKKIGKLVEGTLITLANKDDTIMNELEDFSTSKLDDGLITFQQKYKNKWIYRTGINTVLESSRFLNFLPKPVQKTLKSFLEEMKQDDPLTTSDFLDSV